MQGLEVALIIKSINRRDAYNVNYWIRDTLAASTPGISEYKEVDLDLLQ